MVCWRQADLLAKKLYHAVKRFCVKGEAQQLCRLQYPVDTPRTTAVQALVMGW